MVFRNSKSQYIKPGLLLESSWVPDHPSQTPSFRSSGFNRSRSASELLHTQKTKVPRLSTVCSGIPRHPPGDIFGINDFFLFMIPRFHLSSLTISGSIYQKLYSSPNIKLFFIRFFCLLFCVVISNYMKILKKTVFQATGSSCLWAAGRMDNWLRRIRCIVCLLGFLPRILLQIL